MRGSRVTIAGVYAAQRPTEAAYAEPMAEPYRRALRHNGEEVEMTKGRIVWVIALLALFGTACGAGPLADGNGDDPTTTAAPSADTSTSLEPVPGTITPADPPVTSEPDPGAPLPEQPTAKIPRALEPFAAAAVADLAKRLGVDESTITVAVAEFMVWPDGSLGCPEPGMAYTQVQVEGSRAVLIQGNSTYFYHGGEGVPGPFLCENPKG